MKQRKFKIKNTTLFVYKTGKLKSHFMMNTEPTTNLPTTTTLTTGIFNK